MYCDAKYTPNVQQVVWGSLKVNLNARAWDLGATIHFTLLGTCTYALS